MPDHDVKYIKATVKKINGVVNTKFWGTEVPKEDAYYTFIASISIDSVMEIEKKLSKSFLEEWNFKIKKRKTPRFRDSELEELDSG